MRVMHVITGLGSGGAERMLVRVASAAQREGIEQSVVSMMNEGFFGPVLREAGVPVRCLDLAPGHANLAALKALAQHIKTDQPDVVMTWLYHADLAGTLAARLAGFDMRRAAWNIRCSEMNFSRYSWKMRVVVRILAFLSGQPGAVASNSRAGIDAHQRLGYVPRMWRFLPNGFDLTEWKPDPDDRTAVRAALGLSEASVVGFCVARRDPQKDHATLLAAFETAARAHPHLHLVLVGSGTKAICVPSEIKTRVIALGERHDVARLLRGADFAVSSSSYGEGFPNVLGEAMASGLPCISTDVGDAAEIIGDTGFVVPASNGAAIAASISTLVTMEAEERINLGVRARDRIAARFGVDRAIAAYKTLWEDLALPTKQS